MEKLESTVFELVKEKTSQRFKEFSHMKSNIISKHLEEGITNHSLDCRSEILVYGTDITLRFQLFYSVDISKVFLSSIYQDIKEKNVFDFFNEVSNLSAGKVKEVLYEQGISGALSLPIGVNSSNFKTKLNTKVLPHTMCWSFFSEEDESLLFSFRSSMCIHRPEKFSSFDPNYEMGSDDDGDIEFF